MKTETCACQVGRELRSTSSQAVLSHTSPALDSPARPRRPIDRPHGRSRLQAHSPSNSSTSRGWSSTCARHGGVCLLRRALPLLPAAVSRGPSCGAECTCTAASLLVRSATSSARKAACWRSPHMPGRVSVCILYAYLTKDVPSSLYDSDDSKTKRNFLRGLRRPPPSGITCCTV